METELFMECEEEELEPWQQVDDSVEEEDVDFVDSCDPGEQLQHRLLLLQELKSEPSSHELIPVKTPCLTPNLHREQEHFKIKARVERRSAQATLAS